MGWRGLKRQVDLWRCRWLAPSRRCLLVWGDSNSCLPDDRSCWPALLTHRFDGGLCLFNESVSGRTSGFDSNDLNSCQTIDQRLSVYHRLTDVFVMLGTNDVKRCYGSLNTAHIEAQFRCIAETIQRHRSHPAAVFLLPPPIHSAAEDDFKGGYGRIERICSILKALCQSMALDCIDINARLDPYRHLESDGVHLNATGRQRVADSVHHHILKSEQLTPHPQSVRSDDCG